MSFKVLLSRKWHKATSTWVSLCAQQDLRGCENQKMLKELSASIDGGTWRVRYKALWSRCHRVDATSIMWLIIAGLGPPVTKALFSGIKQVLRIWILLSAIRVRVDSGTRSPMPLTMVQKKTFGRCKGWSLGKPQSGVLIRRYQRGKTSCWNVLGSGRKSFLLGALLGCDGWLTVSTWEV